MLPVLLGIWGSILAKLKLWECQHPFIEDAMPTFPAGTHSTGKQKFLDLFGNLDRSLSFQFAGHVLQEYFHFIYANSGFSHWEIQLSLSLQCFDCLSNNIFKERKWNLIFKIDVSSG